MKGFEDLIKDLIKYFFKYYVASLWAINTKNNKQEKELHQEPKNFYLD